jgi:hypothetical protein
MSRYKAFKAEILNENTPASSNLFGNDIAENVFGVKVGDILYGISSNVTLAGSAEVGIRFQKYNSLTDAYSEVLSADTLERPFSQTPEADDLDIFRLPNAEIPSPIILTARMRPQLFFSGGATVTTDQQQMTGFFLRDFG